MSERVTVESLREVAIYLNQIMDDLEEIKQGIEMERRDNSESRSKRNFMLITSFVAPIILTFAFNAAGLGK